MDLAAQDYVPSNGIRWNSLKRPCEVRRCKRNFTGLVAVRRDVAINSRLNARRVWCR